MKRTSLTTAVIAGIAGVAGVSSIANAVYLNNDGLGQALIYPYYTVNNGQSTVITVVNTTNQGKAVKVRFREALDSREVLDFNLYLSPYDFWAGQVIPFGAGAGLTSTDNSCTVPQIPAGGVAFRTYAFDGSAANPSGEAIPADGGPTGVSRTLEGYAEIIEMGVVTGPSLGYITHKAGVPANCAAVQAAWVGPSGYWEQNADTDITYASGGLFGSGTIVNVTAGTVFSYNADAIDQFYVTTGGQDHFQPGYDVPNLSEAAGSTTSYVFASSGTGVAPGAITTTYTRTFPSVAGSQAISANLDAVTSLFMAQNIYNEFWANSTFQSEWVITFPTKRYYVDPQFSTGASVPVAAPGTAAPPPFDYIFNSNKSASGQSCSGVAVQTWDREEGSTISTTGPDFSPTPVGVSNTPQFCFETNVLTFNQGAYITANKASQILGSAVASNVDVDQTLGWAQVTLTGDNHYLQTATTDTFFGLPATGFWVTEFTNDNVSNGVLANYTSLYGHKRTRLCNQSTIVAGVPTASGVACN